MITYIKKLVPKPFLSLYHLWLSWVAAMWYGHPSEELIVIGVTGTNGKTTTAYLASKALEAAGELTGCTTTALFKIASREWLNDKKMTMLGRFQLQKMLREMVKAGCRYAVIETSSQGILQYRHRHINYDVVVFTNLTPEHIEAHGGFENYKQAKLELFRHAAKSKRKKSIPKIAILNRTSEYAKEFALPGFDQTVWYGIGEGEGVSAMDVKDEGWSTSFSVDGLQASVHLPGRVNVENALAAIAVARSLGLSLPSTLKKLEEISGIPGRFERIDEGQSFTVIVDYAPEPASLAKLYETVSSLPHGRIIHVLGSAGGGRDVARRPILGRMAAEHADVVIVTNEDPYDDDPKMIMEQVASGARSVAAPSTSIHVIADRREAISFAMREATPGDIVLLTGKGCEQGMMVANGKMLPWDDRKVAREELHVLPYRHVSP